jgi:hypothetical protein
MEFEIEMRNFSNNNNNNNIDLNIMQKIEDIQKQLDNLTDELKIFVNKRIILLKSYNILLTNEYIKKKKNYMMNMKKKSKYALKDNGYSEKYEILKDETNNKIINANYQIYVSEKNILKQKYQFQVNL